MNSKDRVRRTKPQYVRREGEVEDEEGDIDNQEMEEAEEDVDDAEEETEEEIRRRPIRERRAPKVLIYPELGKPSYSGES